MAFVVILSLTLGFIAGWIAGIWVGYRDRLAALDYEAKANRAHAARVARLCAALKERS